MFSLDNRFRGPSGLAVESTLPRAITHRVRDNCPSDPVHSWVRWEPVEPTVGAPFQREKRVNYFIADHKEARPRCSAHPSTRLPSCPPIMALPSNSFRCSPSSFHPPSPLTLLFSACPSFLRRFLKDGLRKSLCHSGVKKREL